MVAGVCVRAVIKPRGVIYRPVEEIYSSGNGEEGC